MGKSTISAALYMKELTKKNFIAEFVERMSVLFVKQQSGVSEPSFGGDLKVHPQLVGKTVVDFLYVIIEHFSIALTAEALTAKIR